jgi:hypothetical protein
MDQQQNPCLSGILFWRAIPEEWELQRHILSLIAPDTANRETTIEQWNELEVETAKKARETGMLFLPMIMKPTWVCQELQARRLPITKTAITEIFDDPLGIDHFGFHTPLPRKKRP